MMRSSLLAPVLTLLVLVGGLALRQQSDMDPLAVESYHEQVRQAVAELPYRVGDWIGVDVPVPASAQKLLRPNAIFSRAYRNTRSGHEVSVVLVHCRDTRDMVGHFPPVCYPAHGWTDETNRADWESLEDTRIYRFDRKNGDESRGIVVWSFFELPVVGRVADMESLRRLDEIRARKTLGAAQAQILFDSSVRDAEQKEVASEFESVLQPVLDRVREWPE